MIRCVHQETGWGGESGEGGDAKYLFSPKSLSYTARHGHTCLETLKILKDCSGQYEAWATNGEWGKILGKEVRSSRFFTCTLELTNGGQEERCGGRSVQNGPRQASE